MIEPGNGAFTPVFPMVLAAGLFATTLIPGLPFLWLLLLLSLTGAAVYAWPPSFWTLPLPRWVGHPPRQRSDSSIRSEIWGALSGPRWLATCWELAETFPRLSLFSVAAS